MATQQTKHSSDSASVIQVSALLDLSDLLHAVAVSGNRLNC